MKFTKTVGRHLATLGTLGIVVALLATIYLVPTHLFHWVTFLAGILVAAVLAMVVRASRAEWVVARRSAQLVAMRAKYAREVQLRTRAEEALRERNGSLDHIHLGLPAMVFYADEGRMVRFHNAAFAEWTGAKGDQIDDHALGEVLPSNGQHDIIERIGQALDGLTVVAEVTLAAPKGGTERLAMQFIPRFGADGRVVGAYAILTEITRRADLKTEIAAPAIADGRALYVEAISEELPGWRNVPEQLRHALQQDEFRLFCQAIMPATSVAVAAPFYEILIRLNEEERNLIPPGVFLQLAEEHGMLPEIDRWVVRHLLDWAGADRTRQNAAYSVNVSGQTLADPTFPDFVAAELRGRSLRAFTLCFEFAESEALASPEGCAAFVRRVRQEGCRTAMSGFGRNLAAFDLLKSIPVNYLKIDASIILGLLRGPGESAKVKAINRVAHAAGIATVAECVEDDATFAALRDLGVDFAQGFGVERPTPLDGLRPEARRRRPDENRRALAAVA